MKTCIFLLIFSLIISAQNYNDLSAFDQAEKSLKQVPKDTVQPDTTNYESEEIDNLVYISIDDSAYSAIESIQKAVFKLKARLEKDKHGKKILSLDPDDQRRYMDFLSQHNLLSPPAIFCIAEDLLSVAQLEYESAELVMSTQSGDQRAKIFLHIKKLRANRDSARSYVTYLAKKN